MKILLKTSNVILIYECINFIIIHHNYHNLIIISYMQASSRALILYECAIEDVRLKHVRQQNYQHNLAIQSYLITYTLFAKIEYVLQLSNMPFSSSYCFLTFTFLSAKNSIILILKTQFACIVNTINSWNT